MEEQRDTKIFLWIWTQYEKEIIKNNNNNNNINNNKRKENKTNRQNEFTT